MTAWLPIEKVAVVFDNKLAATKATLKGIPIAGGDDLVSFDVDCIVVCADPYLEIMEQVEGLGFGGDCYFINELFPANVDEQSQLRLLQVDLAVQKKGSLIALVFQKPQILVNVTYRLTKLCQISSLLLPFYLVGYFLHTLTCVLFSIDLPLSVEAGGGLRFPHFGGIVIHPNARLGAFCTIWQGVTIGSNDTGAVPRIGDFAFIYAKATILGASDIKEHTRIGAHALVIDHHGVGYSSIYCKSVLMCRELFRPDGSKVKATETTSVNS